MGSIINTTSQNVTCDKTNEQTQGWAHKSTKKKKKKKKSLAIIVHGAESRPETSKLVKVDTYRVRFPFGQSFGNLPMHERHMRSPALEAGSCEGLGVGWGQGWSFVPFLLSFRRGPG